MRCIRGMIVATVLALAMAARPATATAAEPFRIASDGQFVVDLVLDPQLDPKVRKDLSRVLRTLVGSEPAIAESKSARHAIVVGAKSFPTFSGQYDALPEDDSFRIALSDGDLHLVGATPQAAHFALYTFLQDLGCRWFMPGDIGEVLPRRAGDLAWTGEPRTETPDFSFRQIWWAYGGPAETAEDFRGWLLRNKVAFPRINHGHNLTNTVPPKEYFESHPEYYALVDGERKPTQLCTSKPDVIRLSIEAINAYFDKNPDVLSYSLCPDDNRDFCECANCIALDAGGREMDSGDPIVTDRLMVYLNAVARGIQQRHPGKMVTSYAYVNYSTPPVREKVDPHVVIVFTTSVYCGAHGIGDEHCESRQKMKKDLAGWAKACDHVYIYEYDPTPYNAELPWPMYGTHARAMPVYKAMGIRGFSFEAHNSWAMLFPNFYVSAKMMWDADQDYDALMDDMCERFFGEGAAAMRAYYSELDRAMRVFPTRVDWGQDDYPRIFTNAVTAKCRDHLDGARRAAREGKAKVRLEMVAMGFEYLENYLVCRNAARGGTDYDDYKQARARCESLIDEMYAINKDFIMAKVARDYLDRELGSLESRRYARELGLVNHWMLIGPFDNTGGRGHERVYLPEKAIDLSKSYEGKDGKRVEWFEFRGREWQGAINLALLISPKDWTTAYALCYVTSPRKQAVQFRVGSNDSIKVWLNDAEVWDKPIPPGRQLKLDDDIVPVTLPKGTSRILLKISNLAKSWGFCFRITDEAGRPIEGLRFSIKP